jgi:hypothetical protein
MMIGVLSNKLDRLIDSLNKYIIKFIAWNDILVN